MAEHARLRKNWDSGFSNTALKGYEECIRQNVEMTISQVSDLAKNQQIIAIDEVIYWFGFDLMGELGFSKSFGNIKERKIAQALKVSK